MNDQYLLTFYYDKIFPWNALEKWLGPHSLPYREFSMTVPKTDQTGEYYLRWQSFESIDQLKNKIVAMKPPPVKFDIGAVYSMPTSMKGANPSSFRAVEKELIFDIDMNDYDDIRTCCKDKKICNKCWKFLLLAMEVLELTLRNDFDFHQILWVFSGRRGVHCWISDPHAKMLPNEGRAAVADYLNLATGGANQVKKVRLGRGNIPHPMVRRSYECSLKLFEVILKEQKLMDRNSYGETVVMTYMNDCKTDIKNAFLEDKKCNWSGTSVDLWAMVKKHCFPRDVCTPMEILLSLCYPRLDIQVSRELSHLLKSPFCVHPATQSICVPIVGDMKLNFEPSSCPTLETVCKQHRNSKHQTDLTPYTQVFEK